MNLLIYDFLIWDFIHRKSSFINRELIRFSFQLVCWFGDFPGRKINLMDCMCRTGTDTFPAKSALAEVNVCQVVF